MRELIPWQSMVIEVDEECAKHQETQGSEHSPNDAHASPMATASSSTSSTDTHNFVRFCRLLLELTPTVLSALFKACFKASEGGKDWSASHADIVLDQIDDYGKRRLGKAALDKIVAGECEEWDITLLASLLLIKPGYMADVKQAKEAIDKIRQARNDMMHSNLLTKQSMPSEEYEACWRTVSGVFSSGHCHGHCHCHCHCHDTGQYSQPWLSITSPCQGHCHGNGHGHGPQSRVTITDTATDTVTVKMPGQSLSHCHVHVDCHSHGHGYSHGYGFVSCLLVC